MTMNDKRILEYLKPNDNEMLSKVNNDDLKYLIDCLDKYYLEYRDSLNIGKDYTFGIEIEFENYVGWCSKGYIKFMSDLSSIVGNCKWDLVNDWSLRNGGEIVSEILNDTKDNWDKIENVCNYIALLGQIDYNAGAHVHVGGHVLGDNPVYWCRLFKLWSIYENIIYRFSYGEHFGYRYNITKYARPAALFYMESLKKLNVKNNYSLSEMLWYIEPLMIEDRYTKNFGLSYWKMLCDDDYNIYKDFNHMNKDCTVEFRVPNGTFNEIIWQNNINLFIKMILYCKSDRYNEDIIIKRKKIVEDNFSVLSSYSLIYLEQALEFSDMVFDNNLDKLYFLKQYIKDINDNDKRYIKTKKLTVSDKIWQ